MIFPVVVYFIIFRYWPMWWLRVAFYDFEILRGFEGSEFVGLEYFITFLRNPRFLEILWNTVYLNILSLAFAFAAPIILALLLNEIFNSKLKRVVQTISYLPFFLSTVVVVTMIETFLSPSIGTLNNILGNLGLEEIYFLGRAEFFRPIMIISDIWQGVGWGSIIYLSAISGIDTELYESAVIDGAKRYQQILFISIPGIITTIMIVLILQMGQLLSVGFEKVFLLQNPMNIGVSEVLATYVFRRGIVGFDFGFATAVGLFNGVASLILILLANRLSKKYSEVSLL